MGVVNRKDNNIDGIIELEKDDQLDPVEASVLTISSSASNMLNFYLLFTMLPLKPNMTTLEMRVLHFLLESSLEFYHASRDTKQMQMWDNIRESLFGNLRLMQLSLYAYLGMLLLGNHNPRFLLGETPVDDGLELSIAKVYTFSMNLYSYLLRDLTRQMEPLLANTISRVDAEILIASISFLFSILGSSPVGTCPLIDFTRGGNDFISFCIGFRQTGIAVYPIIRELLLVDVVAVEFLPLMDQPLLPFFKRILLYLDSYGSGDGNDLMIIRQAFELLNRQVYCTTVHRTPVAFFQTFTYTSESVWNLLYKQVPLALSWLHVLSAFSLMFEFHFIRENNIWIEYMNWYKQWIPDKFPWDVPLYQVVVDQGYYAKDYLLFHQFDPLDFVNTHYQ